MTEEPDRLVLDRPRDLGALISDSLRIFRRHLGTFLLIALAVVVPVHAIVLGVGLDKFSGDYDSALRPAEAVVITLVQFLVVGPLVAVMALHAVREIAEGRKPRAGASIQAGLDAFSIVFWPVLIAILIEAATLITIILPFILIVRWYFVPQLVVLEKKRGPDALRASWELTRGLAWRAAGLILVVRLLFELGGNLISTPVVAIAQSADSEALSLAATTLAEVLVAAPLGIFAALLFYDLTTRQAALRR